MGGSILPRLAATVCITITGTRSFRSVSPPMRRSTTMVNGTKVISETSLVMNMLKKKQSPHRISTMELRRFTRLSSSCARRSKIPSR